MLLGVWVPWADVGCLALAMTPIVLVGGIDLSIGSIVALCGILLGMMLDIPGLSPVAAIFLTIVAGAAAGSLNGLLVNLGVSPLVTTLATMAFFRGLAMSISSAESITGFPEWFVEASSIGGVPLQYLLLVVVFLTTCVVVHFTVFGRWIYAVGDNRLASRFAAVPDGRVDFLLYVHCGVIAALVAILNAMRHNVAMPDAHLGMELQAIACIVVGGTLITGGHGSVPRTLLGLAVVSSLDVALGLLSTSFQQITSESRLIVIGALLIVVAIWSERTEGAPQ
jgi:rhamnose transport system permease protein